MLVEVLVDGGVAGAGHHAGLEEREIKYAKQF